MECRSCNKTFNFITKPLFYDEASGFCKTCLHNKLADFAQTYRAHLLQRTFPAQWNYPEVADSFSLRYCNRFRCSKVGTRGGHVPKRDALRVQERRPLL
jgi:hypothetical protein